MSHFAVLVVGNNIEKQLEPFHEFECTGIESHVVEIDKTEEVKKEMAEHTQRKLKDQDGHLYDPYEDRFYRDPTEEEKAEIGKVAGTGCTGKFSFTSKDWGDGLGYRTKIRFVPDGWEEVDVPFTSIKEYFLYMYGDENCIVKQGEEIDLTGDQKYRYALEDDNGEITKVIIRTNPNSKWDWYQIGGRYAGLFKLKPDVDRENDLYKKAPQFSWGWSTEEKIKRINHVDQAFKKDIDFDSVIKEAEEKAAEDWDVVHSMINFNQPFKLWSDYLKDVDNKLTDYKTARTEYHSQAIVKEWSNAEHRNTSERVKNLFLWESFDNYVASREDYIREQGIKSIMTFAILKDGKWHQKGKMGRFGSSTTEDFSWEETWKKIFDSIPDDEILTIVDCHI